MALELISVELHTIFLTMNYMSHQPLSFSFYWTGNRIWDFVISYQNHMHKTWQSKARVKDVQ